MNRHLERITEITSNVRSMAQNGEDMATTCALILIALDDLDGEILGMQRELDNGETY